MTAEKKKETVAKRLEKLEGKTVDLTEKVTITGTKESKHLVEGKKYKVHPILADKLKKQKDAV